MKNIHYGHAKQDHASVGNAAGITVIHPSSIQSFPVPGNTYFTIRHDGVELGHFEVAALQADRDLPCMSQQSLAASLQLLGSHTFIMCQGGQPQFGLACGNSLTALVGLHAAIVCSELVMQKCRVDSVMRLVFIDAESRPQTQILLILL